MHLTSTSIRCLIVAMLLGASCAPARFVVVRQNDHPPAIAISQIRLEWSNVFLLRRGDAAMLVDAGSPGDWDRLVDALHAEGLSPADLRIVVLTHAHADHSGLAARLQQAGVPIAIGHGDEPMAARGHNDPLRPTGAFATLLRPAIDFAHAPFTPDVRVAAPRDLYAFGFPEVRVEPMPGHTPGSLVLWVGDREVLAGDTMLGGTLGGTFSPGIAGEHYYQGDVRRNHCNVDQLLNRGAQRFYVGHGGPIDRASVVAWRATWAADALHCSDARVAAP